MGLAARSLRAQLRSGLIRPIALPVARMHLLDTLEQRFVSPGALARRAIVMAATETSSTSHMRTTLSGRAHHNDVTFLASITFVE